jgi:nucleoid-associated protein YgaU
MVELKHAIIEVLDLNSLGPDSKLQRLMDVQFNPTEYTLSKSAQIAEIGIYGIDSPILQFIRGQNEKLTMDLFFDTTTLPGGLGNSAVSVKTKTEPFYQLCKIQPTTHAPPRIRFTWSEDLKFEAIVESVQQKFTLFNPAGVPLRATLSVTFREYKSLERQLSDLKLESTDHTKRRVAQRGDTLSRIAAQEYGDPRLWRRIAEANPEVASPRRLRPGQVLLIPPLETFSRPLVDGR